jgi:3-oxoacyl-[acyl-carrier-protein] synthase II
MTDRSSRRVFITGIGVLTAIGTGVDAFRAGLRAAKSPVKRIDRFDPSAFRSQVAAQVDDFDPLAWMTPKTARQLDRFSQFGLVTGMLALDDAGLRPGEDGAADPARIGIYLGSALGGIAYAEEQHERYMDKGIRQVAPNLALAVFGGAAPANIGIALGVRGPILSTANSCASGAVAIGEAVGAIRAGEIDAAIAGGCEVPLSSLAFGAFDIIRALSGGANDDPEHACRPFDKDRDGFIIGEGAGVLILEELEHARRRGATIYAEIVGYGMSSDAYHMTAPSEDGDGARRVMAMAIRKAGIAPSDVDYINAHGTSTPYNDRLETLAIHNCFGEHAEQLAISSTKSMTGHLLGGAGGLEAGITVLAVHNQIAPPTVNLDAPDPECDLDYVPHYSRQMPIRYALSNSFGFGGTNAALLFKRFEA